MILKKYFVLFVYLFLLGAVAFAQVRDLPVFSNEFWFHAENPPVFHQAIGGNQNEHKEHEAERIKDLLREAVFVYSGMIFGFTFTYTPSDRRRDISEELIITPIARIPYGDPAMRVRSIRRDVSRTFVRLEYRCDERHQAWLNFWSSSAFPVIGGSGTSLAFEGLESRIEAMEQAAKTSIRNHLRGRIHNQPRRISGSFVFIEPPIIRHVADRYTASVRIKVDIENVESFTFF